jgi:hypothetical protein
MSDQQQTRREILKKAVYVAPVILTLPAIATFASAGSGVVRPRPTIRR